MIGAYTRPLSRFLRALRPRPLPPYPRSSLPTPPCSPSPKGYKLSNGEPALDPNHDEAAGHLHAAAEDGMCEAAFRYAICLVNGWGVARSKERAREWMQRAADGARVHVCGREGRREGGEEGGRGERPCTRARSSYAHAHAPFLQEVTKRRKRR